MRDLHSTGNVGPFSSATQPSSQAIIGDKSLGRGDRKVTHQVFRWLGHSLTGIGILTVGAFAVGATPIPEKIGAVTGRIASAATAAQTNAQALLQGEVATAQQQAQIEPQKQIQAWQLSLQGDLATLNSALNGVQQLLVQKTGADLQGRNALLQMNAQLQGDRVRQIMQVREMLERGETTSAQVIDMLKNLGKALSMDTAQLQKQSEETKARVLDSVSKITPISDDNGSGITDPIKPGGILDPDVQVAMSDLQRRISDIQTRFAVRSYVPPRPAQGGRP